MTNEETLRKLTEMKMSAMADSYKEPLVLHETFIVSQH